MKNSVKAICLTSALIIGGSFGGALTSKATNDSTKSVKEVSEVSKEVASASVIKPFEDKYGWLVIDEKNVDTVILAKVKGYDIEDKKYLILEDILNGGEIVVESRYAKDIKDVDGKIVKATIDGTSENNDYVYKLELNDDVIDSEKFLVVNQVVYTKGE